MKCSWELGNILDGQTIRFMLMKLVGLLFFLNVRTMFMALHMLKVKLAGKKKVY